MNNVRHLRNVLKLSQAELASVLGLTQSALSHYETGGCDPLVHTARKLIATGKSRGFFWTLDDVYMQPELSESEVMCRSELIGAGQRGTATDAD